MNESGTLVDQWQGASWPPGAELAPAERRSAPRVRVLKKAKLIHPNNVSVFDCMIRDISEGGARLGCGNAAILPNEMQLMFFALREVRYVRVVWRRPDELGVQFLGPARAVGRLNI